MGIKECAKYLSGVVVLLLILLLFTRPRPPSYPAPGSNGYDDFLKAGTIARTAWPALNAWLEKRDAKAMRNWMTQHPEFFSLVEAGLRKECRVPIHASTNYAAQIVTNHSALKRVTYCMVAKAELARAEGRTNDMFNGYPMAYRFAHEVGRGGLDIDWLSQIGSEAWVLRSLSAAIPDLDPQQCADGLRLFKDTEADREAASAVMRRTRGWQDATLGHAAAARARRANWVRVVKEAWRTRSLDPSQ